MPESAINYGKELLSWEVSDHHGHERGTFWYVAAAVIALGTLIYAVLTRNFLFAFIIIMFGIIIVTHNMHQAKRISAYACYLLNGKVIEYSGTAEMFDNPKNKLTKDYINGEFG